MKRPAYSSQKPGSLRRFPASPKQEPMPTSESMLERIRHHLVRDHMDYEGLLSVTAFLVWWYELDPTGNPVPHAPGYSNTGYPLPTA
jgi:hypothetical protein